MERHLFIRKGIAISLDMDVSALGCVRRSEPCALNKDPKSVVCPHTTVFRTEGRLMFRVMAEGHWIAEVFHDRRPETDTFDLVIDCTNAYFPVVGNGNVFARYCHSWRGVDNVYSRRTEDVFHTFHRGSGEDAKVTMDNGDPCKRAREFRWVYCDSILSQVLTIPIAEELPWSQPSKTGQQIDDDDVSLEL